MNINFHLAYVANCKTWYHSCTGSIPLRQLVYRVLALPPSMQPLVYDFGQLTNTTEKDYTGQIVKNCVSTSYVHRYVTVYIATCFHNRFKRILSSNLILIVLIFRFVYQMFWLLVRSTWGKERLMIFVIF